VKDFPATIRNRPAVLFVRADSVYKNLECDAWDAERNALAWPGGTPVVAHPPCRLWGRLFKQSTAPTAERELALWAVDQVRRWGGVLEHPAKSKLWPAKGLPRPGQRDEFGFTLSVSQWWWGHKAEKNTWLYVCGCEPFDAPEMPFKIGEATHCIAQSSRRQRLRFRPEVTKAEREHTPPAFAAWLLELAGRCHPIAPSAEPFVGSKTGGQNCR
jgi:hypothetical protein